MRQVFLDTGYVLALEGSDDQFHEAAVTHWKQFTRQSPKLVMTSLVFAEIIALINGRGRYAKAIQVGRRLLEDPDIELIHVDERLFRAGWDFLGRHRDKRYSLADCVSFVLMRDRGIRQALAFDRHFEQGGFERLPADGSVP